MGSGCSAISVRAALGGYFFHLEIGRRSAEAGIFRLRSFGGVSNGALRSTMVLGSTKRERGGPTKKGVSIPNRSGRGLFLAVQYSTSFLRVPW